MKFQDTVITALPTEARDFLLALHNEFELKRRYLLKLRMERQEEIDRGEMPDFPAKTIHIREDNEWKISPLPDDLKDRRVEITGPTDRKMVINALNCGAKVFMADFEDSNSPTWENLIVGQLNLQDAVNKTITFDSPQGKHYKLNDNTAVLMVRPRGLHLLEKHYQIEEESISGSLFDFGLYFFHNAKQLIENGTGPYFYLPKLQSSLESRWWDAVFEFSENYLSIPVGTIKATVLIEHILAAFEAEEILYELRAHSAGLNCGRWDYIFSFIKTFRNNPEFVLPDRSQITMTAPFMRSYCLHVIKTCHNRGAPAIGGMAAQIPIKNDPQANGEALSKVLEDKEKEVNDGCSGAWVAHPGLVKIVQEVFDKHMPAPNQIGSENITDITTANELLAVPEGKITDKGLRKNIRVCLHYLSEWLSGNGCVAISNMMEDLATAEISRCQLWQWLKYKRINESEIDDIIKEEVDDLKDIVSNHDSLFLSASYLKDMTTQHECPEFIEYIDNVKKI